MSLFDDLFDKAPAVGRPIDFIIETPQSVVKAIHDSRIVNDDEEEIDPFDWGDEAPAIQKRSPDARFVRAGELLAAHDEFARPLTLKEMAALKEPFTRSTNPHGTAIRHLKELYPGYLFTRTEYYVNIGHAQKKRDFMGVADVVGVRESSDASLPAFVLAQLTTRTGIQPHIRKYTSDATSTDEIPTLRKLLAVLRTGVAEVIVMGYFREMIPTADGKGIKLSNWLYVPVKVTQAMIDEKVERREKLAANKKKRGR